MADRDSQLSRSMEDYLEAIYNLKIRSQVARVKDIARQMDVKMPSVTGAIRSLAEKGLVKHQPYENVELTKEGINLAKDIVQRHNTVKEFLVGALGLDDIDAELEACGIEHAIRPDTLDKLVKFVDFVRACGGNKPLKMDDFQYYLKHGAYPEDSGYTPNPEPEEYVCVFEPTDTPPKLSDLCPGMKGRILSVGGKGAIRKRLMDMGLTSDAQFEVLRAAPLGDPIEIKIRGYYLSLRKSEAECIEVEVIE